MKRIPISSIFCAAILALCSHAYAAIDGWSVDFAASQKLATESNKDLLLNFTGSDWIKWCIKLNDEVFKTDAFKAYAKDPLVLVEINFPKDKTKLSEQTQKQNEDLAAKYAVEGHPTVILCDASGLPYASTGYFPGGPEVYIGHLNRMRSYKAKRDEAFAAAAKVSGVEKARLLIAGLDAMGLDDAVLANFYSDVIKQILAADPQDETSYAKKAANKKRIIQLQTELDETSGNGNIDAALVVIDKTLKEGGFDEDTTQQIIMQRAMLYSQQKKFDEAIKAVDEAKALAPTSKLIPKIDGFRKKLEEEAKAASKK